MSQLRKEEAQKTKEKQQKLKDAEKKEIDDNNEAHLESEAALNDVKINLPEGVKVKSSEPLMPSKEASKFDLGPDSPPKKRVAPISNSQKIKNVVAQSLKINKDEEKKEKEALALIKAKQTVPDEFRQEHVTELGNPTALDMIHARDKAPALAQEVAS